MTTQQPRKEGPNDDLTESEILFFRAIDRLLVTLIDVYAVVQKHGNLGDEDELTLQRSQLQAIDGLLESRPLAACSAVQLSFLTMLIAHWHLVAKVPRPPGDDEELYFAVD